MRWKVGGHGVGRPLKGLAGASNDTAEALAQIDEVVRRLKIDRRSVGCVEEIAVQDFVRAADFRTPTFEHVLLSSVVLGVGIEVEVAPDRWAQVLLIEAPELIDQSRVRRQCLEVIALRGGKAHDRAQDQFQVFPIQILGLFDILSAQQQGCHPLSQNPLRRWGNL
jgi:hypothetical protein